jgi:hypothetical protein
MVPASSIQWGARLTTGALFTVREQEGDTFGAYGKIVPEATLGIDVKNLLMITPRIDFGLVAHVAYQMYLFDSEGYDGTFNILGFGVLPRVRMDWGKASLYVLGGIETTAMREHAQNIMVYRGFDVPFTGVVWIAGVGGTFLIGDHVDLGLEALWQHQSTGYRDSVGVRLLCETRIEGTR